MSDLNGGYLANTGPTSLLPPRSALAEDLPVISRHERRLHSVTGHRRSDTAYGNSGSIAVPQLYPAITIGSPSQSVV